jgi:hypothetical protein
MKIKGMIEAGKWVGIETYLIKDLDNNWMTGIRLFNKMNKFFCLKSKVYIIWRNQGVRDLVSDTVWTFKDTLSLNFQDINRIL